MELMSSLVRGLKRIHLNYNMITSLYMMEPMERTIINCFLLLIVSLMMYSSWVYLPHYTLKLLIFSGILSRPGDSIIGQEETIFNYNSEL